MNYMKIDPCSIANGDGVRVALFVSGCNIHCKNCHNREAWDFNAGQKFPQEIRQVKELLYDKMEPDYIAGLSILGGEPLEEENICTVVDICHYAKVFHPDKTIWLYTGKVIDPNDVEMWSIVSDFTPYGNALLSILNEIDVLVDGPFMQEQADPDLVFKGSRNQRIWKRNEAGDWEVAG